MGAPHRPNLGPFTAVESAGAVIVYPNHLSLEEIAPAFHEWEDAEATGANDRWMEDVTQSKADDVRDVLAKKLTHEEARVLGQALLDLAGRAELHVLGYRSAS